MPRLKQPEGLKSAAVSYGPGGAHRSVELVERPGFFHGYALTFIDGDLVQMLTLDDDDLDALHMAVSAVRLARSEEIPPDEACVVSPVVPPFEPAAAACEVEPDVYVDDVDLLEDEAA